MNTLRLLICILLLPIAADAQDFEWVKTFGGVQNDYGIAAATDPFGNVYITGTYFDTLDFDPGVGTANMVPVGFADIFVLKLDSSGNYLWVKSFGGTNFDRSKAISVDGNGNVYTTGYFQDTVDFDPGSGTLNLGSKFGYDIFIQKLDAAGNLLWARSFGGQGFDESSDIEVDGAGNVYLSGFFEDSVDFDPGAGTSTLNSAGAEDIFILKLDTSGNYIWARSLGAALDDRAEAMSVDQAGNVYTAGRFQASVDFDPGTGINTLSSAGGQDIFIQKLNAAGNFQWAHAHGSNSFDATYDLRADASGNVYSTGVFTGTVDFDPGPGTNNLIGTGTNVDAYIQKLDSSGNFIWAKSFGGVFSDGGTSLDLDAAGNVYTAGYFWDTVDFDPGIDSLILVSNGATDFFVQKLTASGDFLWARSFGGTGFDGISTVDLDFEGNIYSTGSFRSTMDFDPGPDTNIVTSNGGVDLYVHKMRKCRPRFGTDSIVACDSLTWINGISYTASNNTATDTLFTSLGCDSIVSLHLTINNSSSSTENITACDSYTWIDGNTYTQSNNTAFVVLTNSVGCDSTVNLNLTINSVSDITTTLSGTSLTANNANASYQWLDCDNNFAIIPGETSQTFTATQNGNYAVQLSENGCVDTSACTAITNVGILENSFGHALALFPNPTKQEVFINLGASYREIDISVTNTSGSIVYQRSLAQARELALMLDLPPGVYFVAISSEDKKATFRLVKE